MGHWKGTLEHNPFKIWHLGDKESKIMEFPVIMVTKELIWFDSTATSSSSVLS